MSLLRAAAGVALVLSGCRAAPIEAGAVMQIVDRAFPLRAATPGVDLEVPPSAAAATKISVRDHKGLSIELEPLGLRATPVTRVGNALVFVNAALDTDVVWTGNEELRVLRSPSADTTARYRVTLGAQIAAVRVSGDTIEALDESGGVRIKSEPLYAIDARGVRRSVRAVVHNVGDHLELETRLDAHDLAYPIVVDPAWSAVAPMGTPRAEHAISMLAGDIVLVTGGRSAAGSLSTAETFDPATKAWSATGSMSTARYAHTATTLSTGKVLVVGGTSDGSNGRSTAELYDPVAKTWSAAASMTYLRAYHTATLLPGDKVLVVGGSDLSPGGQTGSAEIYDAATNTWSAAGTMANIRQDHTATLLASGQVLIVGGRRAGATFLAGTELFDPATRTWSASGNMLVARSEHAAVLLSGGMVLVSGGRGSDSFSMFTHARAELYDPATKTWKATNNPMSTSRVEHTATALPGDRALIVGGASAATVELFTLSDARFSPFAALGTARSEHATAQLANKNLLAIGGTSPSLLASVELLQLGQPGDACTTGTTECASGFCVDGVCCDVACDGQCEACNVEGKKGTCSAVTGTPHGSRTACSDGAGKVCEARFCDGVDRKACIAFADSNTLCAPASCAEGSAKTPAMCDGKGVCPAQTAAPCAPYACGVAGCKTSCAADSDCAGDNVCDKNVGRCVVADTTCSDDGLAAQPLDRTQPPRSCAPFRCNADNGKCHATCTTSDVCGPGAVCDPTTRACVTSAAPEDDGGCAYGPAAGRGGLFAFAALLFTISRRRTRR